MKTAIIVSGIAFLVSVLFIVSIKIAVWFWSLFFSLAVAKTIVLVINIAGFLLGAIVFWVLGLFKLKKKAVDCPDKVCPRCGLVYTNREENLHC